MCSPVLRTLLIALGTFTILASEAKPTRTRIRAVLPDRTVETFALEKYRVRPQPGLEYHWWKGQRLQSTVGGLAGALLDGPYAEYTTTGQLITQGEMRKGLRHGEWRNWDAQGKLRDITVWRNGRVHSKQLAMGGEGITEKKLERLMRKERRKTDRVMRKTEKEKERSDKPKGVKRVKKGKRVKSEDVHDRDLKKKKKAEEPNDGPTKEKKKGRNEGPRS